MTGGRLAHYEVKESLGAGGMGEVYRATDTKLDREVALKVLPDSMAGDSERVARFQREAKLLASLNHPHIAAIHGFEEAEGKRFLVLELVEGPTLAERLKAGPLMVEESLDIAHQIAEALEAAHERGIVHRDLKPANIKLTPDGKVKVLDFGLAKALVDEDATADPTSSPTITEHFTQPGVILGTAAYMSPEQARGRRVDKRTDIWAFGCVLYECLTGITLFAGETVTDSVGAVLHKQPEWDKLPANTPPTIQLLLRRCLAKDRQRRLRDIGDVRLELEAAVADPTSSVLGLASEALVADDTSSLWSLRGAAAILTSMLLTAVVALAVGWSLWPEPLARHLVVEAPSPPLEHLMITVPQRESETSDTRFNSLDVSADGSVVAYLAYNDSGGTDLFLRWQDQLEPQWLTSSRLDMRFPTLSPDAKWCAYFDRAERKLFKISVRGGPKTTLCDEIVFLDGLTWTTDGFLVFVANSNPNTLMRIGENGGSVEEIELPATQEQWLRFVHALPGGKAVLYTAFEGRRSGGSGVIRVYSFETGSVKDLVPDGTYPIYSSSGHLLFVQDATLMAVPFDVDSLEVAFPAVPALEGVRRGPYGWAQVAITHSGTLFHRQGDGSDAADILRGVYQHQLDGEATPHLISPKMGHFTDLSIAPDGRFLALEVVDQVDGEPKIWVLDSGPGRNVLTLLTREPGSQSTPVFSPDGDLVYYTRNDESGHWLGIFRRKRDGSGEAELVYDGPRECIVMSTHGNDLWILKLPSEDDENGVDIGVVHLDEAMEKPTVAPWYLGPTAQYGAIVSPNGRWVAFVSHHERRGPRVYVKPINGEGALYAVSSGNGTYPVWSPDGKTLYFHSSDRRTLLAADVLRGGESHAGETQEPFELGEVRPVLEFASGRERAEIMPDGKSFLRIAAVQEEGSAEDTDSSVDDPTVIHVTRNFFTELERVAPTKETSSAKESGP